MKTRVPRQLDFYRSKLRPHGSVTWRRFRSSFIYLYTRIYTYVMYTQEMFITRVLPFVYDLTR